METDINLKGSAYEKPSPENSATLFVSLYVVVLAFFIMLAAHAQFDVEKTKNVAESVSKAFSLDIRSDTDIRIPSIGGELSVTQFFEDIQKSLQSIVPLAEMEVVTDGQQMTMTMPTTALFNRDDPNLRHDRRDFYERLSGALDVWRSGVEVNLTMLQGVRKPLGMKADAASTLEITRAGNFARFMENRGIAPQHLSVAIEQGNPDVITLVFDVVSFDERKLNLPQGTDTHAEPEQTPKDKPKSAIPLQSVKGTP